MANDIYGAVNGVRNDIINEPLSTPLRDDTSESIFIFGTAADGPLNVPIKPLEGAAEDQFGEFVLTQYSDRSLLKQYYEALSAGGTDPNFNVRLIRVGNISKAGINLYENIAYGSGDYSPTRKSLSLKLEFDNPGLEGNSATAYITGSGGLPTAMTIGLPSGVEKNFYMDASGETDGYIKNTAELIESIMSDDDIVGAGMVATTDLLEDDYTFTYAGDPNIIIPSDAGTSYGNNLVEITRAYSESENSEVIPSGSSTFVFSEVLAKDTNAATQTVDGFKVVVTDELALTAAIGDQGGNTVTLDALSDAYFVAGTSSITDLEVSLVRSGITTDLTSQSTVDGTNAEVTIASGGDFSGFKVSDKVYVSYKYVVGYTEANVRSDLLSGRRDSYFISGDTITFGASQQYNVEATFNGIREYLWGSDIVLVDSDTSEVRFNNSANIPETGDTVVFTLQYLPELPAPSGTFFSDGSTQVSGFSGGSDGQSMTLEEYQKSVKVALERTFGYPAGAIIIAGAYLDDTVTGYNSETGMKETVNADWQTILSAHVIKKSKYVSECKGYMSVKPMTQLDSESVETYMDRLITVSSSDTLRPANLISNLDSYPLIITANDFIVSVPKVVSDSVYTTPATTIYAVARQLQSKELSPIAYVNKMPDIVRGLAVAAVGWDKLNQINGMRYTFFHRNITGGTQSIIPADAPTLAAAGSSLDRQYVLDVVYLCLKKVRESMQSFIGSKNDDRTRTVMENVAKSTLKELTPNYITAFDVKVSADARDKIDGNTKLKLLLKTAREIRTITEETRIKIV